MEDKRFAHIATDPKFKNIRKGDKKVKIDKRFQSMFKDKKFKVNYTVDKRGRTVNKTSNADLRRYYHLSSEESASEEEESAPEELESEEDVDKPITTKSQPDEDINELDVKNVGDKEVTKDIKHKLKDLSVDYARGEARLLSESSSDDEESESDVSDTEGDIEHKWGELDGDADRTDDPTYRLAACNMDWDRIRAVDLMVLLNSFVPQGGLIKSVTIYPSEFGKERMKEEDLKGPIELVEKQDDDDEKDDEENEEGSKYHMEKLRQYQLNRLKYYYAVIVCDSANTANKIYSECDGMEYESSATKIDLRFIPDDMEFDDEPKEKCEKLPDMVKYQPRFFTTTALQQAKVDLTWDETNPDRLEITQKLAKGKLDEIAQEDLQNYLASSSEDEENEDKDEIGSDEENSEESDPINKYKALLSEIESKEKEKDKKDVQMEISWGIDLEEKTEKMVKKKLDNNEEKTPFQKYLDKRKEKRKEKKQRKKEEDGSSEDESDDVPSDIDMNDPYFAEEFDKPEFKKSSKASKKVKTPNVDSNNQDELELLLMNEDDSKKHFNLKKIQDHEAESKTKKKKNKKKEIEKTDDFEINVNDDRFSALYTSHHFNIDPSDPHYKKTKGMEKIISEKLKRREDDEVVNNKKAKMEVKKDAELNVLVKSVKRKAEALRNKKSK